MFSGSEFVLGVMVVFSHSLAPPAHVHRIIYGVLLLTALIQIYKPDPRVRFPERAIEFLHLRPAPMNITSHRERLRLSNVQRQLVPFLVSVHSCKAIYVIQIGSKRGDKFQAGFSPDDPVIGAVVSMHTRGLLVEPDPESYKMLRTNTAPYVDRYMSVHASVSTSGRFGTVPFYSINSSAVLSEWSTAPSWMRNDMGSIDRNLVERKFDALRGSYVWKPEHETRYYIMESQIASITPRSLLMRLHERFPQSRKRSISLLHVSTGGFEWQTVATFLRECFPEVIVFDRTYTTQESLRSAQQLLSAIGYFSWEQSSRNVYAVYVGLEASQY